MVGEGWLKLRKKELRENETVELNVAGNSQQHAYIRHILISCSVRKSLSPADAAVNQSGAYFQNFENSKKIEEITHNCNFFTNAIRNKTIF